MKVEEEYERIKEIFNECDEKQLQLLEGAIWEAARLRIELDDLYSIVNQTGLVKLNPNNPLMQKELPVSKLIVKTRANYLNYISKLSNILGKNIDDEDDDLNEYA
jgi:hypothetical protein